MKHLLYPILFVILLSACQKQKFQVIIRGGTVYDGSGTAGIVTDVGINSDTVAFIGDLSKAIGEKEIDANERFVAKKIPQYKIVLNDLFEGDLSDIKSWLDVGCGHGEFIIAINSLSKEKIMVLGSEPNIYKQDSARSKGLNVTYFDIETHQNKYDVISLLDVYSHLPNPVLFIQKLKNLLNPNGELILETGDSANFSAKEIPKPLCLPDHLSFASEKIVIDILERNGFEIIKIKKYPYLIFDLKTILKEVVKLFVPNYHSYIKYYFNWKKHSETNMYIRARLK